MITLCPRTPPYIVSAAARINPRIIARSWSIPPKRTKIVPVASVARETRTVSHPTKTRYERKLGTRLPFMPNTARDKTMVGALDRFPANELKPTNAKERMVPIIAAHVACQNDIPKPRKNAPYESASSETLAPHHGQKSEDALPDRSLSAITLVPFNSKFISLCYGT